MSETLLSLSARLHTRGLFIQGMCVCQCVAHACVCVSVSICVVTLWFVFFLYRWFCPLVCVSAAVSFPCRDGLVGCTRRRRKVVGPAAPVSCGLCFTQLHLVASHFQFVFLFSLFCLRHSSLRASTTLSFFTSVRENPLHLHLHVPFNSALSLYPPPLHLSPLSFLRHKHFQSWHTRGDSHAEKQCHNHNEHVEFS